MIDGLYRIPATSDGMIADTERNYYTWSNEYGTYDGYYDRYGNFLVGYWDSDVDFVEYGYFDTAENYHDIYEYPYALAGVNTAADSTDEYNLDADGVFSYHITSGDYDGWVEAQYMDQAFGMAAANTWENDE